jgi:flagellar basal-body rod protein FlgC
MAQSVEGREGGEGVRVSGIALGDAEGRMVFSPDHPLADADGYVRMPDIDLGSQMSQLIMAQRGFQAQSSVIRNAQDVYSSALSIGKQA